MPTRDITALAALYALRLSTCHALSGVRYAVTPSRCVCLPALWLVAAASGDVSLTLSTSTHPPNTALLSRFPHPCPTQRLEHQSSIALDVSSASPWEGRVPRRGTRWPEADATDAPGPLPL